MGSGPTCHLASTRNPGSVVLMSGYTSIKNVAREKFGILSALVSEQFDNLSIIHKVRSPTLFIHGKQDMLIPYNHSEKLRANCQCKNDILIPEQMTHNDFDFFKDLIRPMLKFFSKIGLKIGGNERILADPIIHE